IYSISRSRARTQSIVQSATTVRHCRRLARVAPAGLRSAARCDMRISGRIPVSQPAAPPLDSIFSFWAFFRVVHPAVDDDFSNFNKKLRNTSAGPMFLALGAEGVAPLSADWRSRAAGAKTDLPPANPRGVP